jgi:hypothetical protein
MGRLDADVGEVLVCATASPLLMCSPGTLLRIVSGPASSPTG